MTLIWRGGATKILVLYKDSGLMNWITSLKYQCRKKEEQWCIWGRCCWQQFIYELVVKSSQYISWFLRVQNLLCVHSIVRKKEGKDDLKVSECFSCKRVLSLFLFVIGWWMLMTRTTTTLVVAWLVIMSLLLIRLMLRLLLLIAGAVVYVTRTSLGGCE